MQKSKDVTSDYNYGDDMYGNSRLQNGFIIFQLRGEFVAIRLAFVQEVFDAEKVRPIPRLSTKFEGIYNLRGEILPILNFEYCIFGNIRKDVAGEKQNKKIVVLNYSDQMFGIHVQEINNIVELGDNNYENVPDTVQSSIDLAYLDSIANESDTIIKILDVDAILKSKFPFLEKYRAIDSKSSESESLSLVNRQKEDVRLDLNEQQKDALKEIMNIASGKAIVAMSKLMKNKVKININVEHVNIRDLMEMGRSDVVDPEDMVVGIRATLSKDLNGVIFLLFSLKKLGGFLQEVEMTHQKIGSVSHIDDLSKDTQSSIQEIGNIIISHFCAGISDFLGIDLYHEVPELAVAEYSAVIDGEIATLSRDSDSALFMKTLIEAESQDIDSEIVFIPYYDSIRRFNKWMNVDQVLTALDKKKEKMKKDAQIQQKRTGKKKKKKEQNKTSKAKKKPKSKKEEKDPFADQRDLIEEFEDEFPDKHAIWNGNETKQYVEWKQERKEQKKKEKEEKEANKTTKKAEKEKAFQHISPQRDYRPDSNAIKAFNISPDDLDAFRELGNMGAGNAGNALSQILNKKVYLEIPPAKILSLQEVAERFPSSRKMIGLIGTTKGFFTSNIFLFFRTQHVENLLKEILNSQTKSLKSKSDLNSSEMSAIKEIFSILMGHYVAAISNFIQKKIDPPDYQFFFKNMKNLFGELIKASEKKDLKAIIVETNIRVEEDVELKGEFILVLSPEIVDKVKSRMDEVWGS